MAWCFNIRTAVATVLIMHPCNSSCVWIKDSGQSALICRLISLVVAAQSAVICSEICLKQHISCGVATLHQTDVFLGKYDLDLHTKRSPIAT